MKRPAVIVLLILCAAAFVAGLIEIFRWRFETGDLYPEYSSLRADPLGTMALYESLEKISGVSARRDYSANNTLPTGRNTTYLHLAAHSTEWSWMDQDTVKEIEGFVTGGGRLVVSFYPDSYQPFDSTDNFQRGKRSNPRRPPKERKRNAAKDQLPPGIISLKERWGLQTTFLSAHEPSGTNSFEAVNESDLKLPESLEWHGTIIFTNLAPSWRVVYARAGNPVVVERRFGRGSVAMATDSYFLSNEALFKDRHPDLLAWCIGPNGHVIFDEAHLGVVENSGVAGLMRKYRLQGLIIGFLVLAGLFVWKNSVSFVPPHTPAGRADFVPGKDSAAGFVNLLRRNVSRAELLQVCFAEWEKSQANADANTQSRAARIQSLIDAEKSRSLSKRDPLALYREICAILKGSQPPA